MERFIYALSNKTSHDIYYIGYTYKNTLKIRKRIDKHLGTETAIFTYDFAKRVTYPKESLLQWYTVLSQCGKRLYPRKNLFQISRNEMKMFMELMDGDWLTDIECAEVSAKPISEVETVEPAYTNHLTGISIYVG